MNNIYEISWCVFGDVRYSGEKWVWGSDNLSSLGGSVVLSQSNSTYP